MENNVINFENAEFGSIRTVVIDGEPWFVGKDVAKILGYANLSEAIWIMSMMMINSIAKCYRVLS